jgi:hypothetical protein
MQDIFNQCFLREDSLGTFRLNFPRLACRYYNDFVVKNLGWRQQNANLNIYADFIIINHIDMLAIVTDGSLGGDAGQKAKRD